MIRTELKKSRGSRSFPPNTCLYSTSAGNAHLNYRTFGSTALMPALGMQAEHLDKEVGSEDGAPASEAAGSNTGSFFAHIHSSTIAFLKGKSSVQHFNLEVSKAGAEVVLFASSCPTGYAGRDGCCE